MGHYTRSDTTGNSLVDYAIASSDMFKLITHFSVHSKFPESDHLPINICLKRNKISDQCVYELNEKAVSNWYSTNRYVWTPNDLSLIEKTLDDSISTEYRAKFLSSISNLDKVQDVANSFTNYVTQAFSRTFCKKKKKYSGKDIRLTGNRDSLCSTRQSNV